MNLADVYDAENRWDLDDDFFLALVNRGVKSRVLDLGCGTGRLTVAIAAAGHAVTGVDPDADSLACARQKPGGELVRWIEGTAVTVDDVAAFDVALMTSHVAQVFITDDEWSLTLDALATALVPGGALAFDTRDPRHRGWERWTREESYAELELPDGSRVATWVDVENVADDVVTFRWANVFDDGAVIEGSDSLRFRSEALLRSTLDVAGLRVEELYGGWRGEPAGEGAGELVVVASRDT